MAEGSTLGVAIGVQAGGGAAGASGVTGSGVAAQVAFWTGTSAIGGSSKWVFTSATGAMSLRGTISVSPSVASGTLFLGAGAGNVNAPADSTGVGAGALANQTALGGANVGLGARALAAMTTGALNIAIGTDAGATLTTASGNILLGPDAGDTAAAALGAEPNQVVILGSQTLEYQSLYLGMGVEGDGNGSVDMLASGTPTNDAAGRDLNLMGGYSRGASLGGAVGLWASPAGAPGSAINTPQRVLTLDGSPRATFAGGIAVTVTSHNTNYTLTASDFGITASGGITLTLPAAPYPGQVYVITKTDAAGTITIDGNGISISGTSTKTMTAQWSSRTVVYSHDANQWLVTASV